MNKRYAFDQVFSSEYEVLDGIFTGKILKHLGDSGKLKCLISYCNNIEVELKNVISIGDSKSDVSIFEAVGKSIALNYSNFLVGKANEYVKSEDLRDVLKLILSDV